MIQGFQGWFDLRTPEDLFRKLLHDHDRLRENHLDTYAAFDFFVTAVHLAEWLGKARRSVRFHDPREHTIWTICDHLGNGAKHFVVNKHDAVEHGDIALGFELSEIDGKFVTTTWERPYIILASDEAAVLGTDKINLIDLADEVLRMWRRHFPDV